MTTAAITAVAPSNKYKKTGSLLGAAAGTAYVAHDSKPLMGYINRNLDKIQIKHPNIHGNFSDIFKSYLKTGKDTGKKGIVILKTTKDIAKRTGVLAGVVLAGAVAGLTVGAIADKIHNAKAKKSLNKVG